MKALARILLAVGLLLVIPSTPVNKQGDHTVEAKYDSRTDQPQTVQEPVKPLEPPEIPLSPKQELLKAAGIPEADWSAADYIITQESTWRHTVWNTSGSGAYGLCQSLPATKMASVGGDYMNNPVTQLKWCHQYALSRYGSWQQAQAFWRSYRWW